MNHQTVGLALIVVFLLLGIVTYPWVRRRSRCHEEKSSDTSTTIPSKEN